MEKLFSSLSARVAQLPIVLFMLLSAIGLRAQEMDYDDDSPMRRSADDAFSMDDAIDYSPLHIGMEDIVLVVALLVACYVFGKIWKGCSYLILILAALFYYLNRF